VYCSVLEVTATVEVFKPGLFIARVAGWEAAHEIISQGLAASSECRASLIIRQQT
jgi:hypothetical protein